MTSVDKDTEILLFIKKKMFYNPLKTPSETHLRMSIYLGIERARLNHQEQFLFSP